MQKFLIWDWFVALVLASTEHSSPSRSSKTDSTTDQAAKSAHDAPRLKSDVGFQLKGTCPNVPYVSVIDGFLHVNRIPVIKLDAKRLPEDLRRGGIFSSALYSKLKILRNGLESKTDSGESTHHDEEANSGLIIHLAAKDSIELLFIAFYSAGHAGFSTLYIPDEGRAGDCYRLFAPVCSAPAKKSPKPEDRHQKKLLEILETPAKPVSSTSSACLPKRLWVVADPAPSADSPNARKNLGVLVAARISQTVEQLQKTLQLNVDSDRLSPVYLSPMSH